MELRVTKCNWADVRREDQTPLAVPAECTELHAMPRVRTGEPLRILGAQVSTQADYESEVDAILTKAWQAYHSKAMLWKTRGSVTASGISPFSRVSHGHAEPGTGPRIY